MPALPPYLSRTLPAGKTGEFRALLAAPPERRTLLLANSRRAYLLVETLVGHCYDLRFCNLAGMLGAGRSASDGAELLTVRQTGRSETELHDLRAHAWAVRGNALRIAGDFPACERALAAAEGYLAAGTGRRRDMAALLLEFSASLRRSQARYSEAYRLLDRALKLRAVLGDWRGLGKVRIQQGILFGSAGSPGQAVHTLTEAVEVVKDDDLLRAGFHCLIWHLIEARRIDRARTILPRVRSLFARGGDLFQLKAQWLEARLEAAIHPRSVAAARRRFESTRRAYEARGLAREARLIALDLERLNGQHQG
jgi:tetratricopeptide (TPR) repeat protein